MSEGITSHQPQKSGMSLGGSCPVETVITRQNIESEARVSGRACIPVIAKVTRDSGRTKVSYNQELSQLGSKSLCKGRPVLQWIRYHLECITYIIMLGSKSWFQSRCQFPANVQRGSRTRLKQLGSHHLCERSTLNSWFLTSAQPIPDHRKHLEKRWIDGRSVSAFQRK